MKTQHSETTKEFQSFNFKLNNTNGTNKKEHLTENDVSDIILLVKNDGVFCVEKKTVLKNAKKTGDGFVLPLLKTDLIKITNRIFPNTSKNVNFKKIVKDALQASIESFISDL